MTELWTDVNDEKPEKYGTYLVTWTGEILNKTQGPFIELIEYSPENYAYDEKWCVYEIEKMGYKNVKIKAWMPAPEPYKE